MSNNNFDFQDMIKSQMLTMGMLNTNDKDGEDNNNFMKIIYGLIVMQMVEAATKAVPVVISEIKRYINNKLEQKRRQYEEKLFAPDPVMKSSIIFDVNKVNCVENETIQSMIDYMCNLDSTIKLRFSNSYIANNTETFPLGYKDIQCKIKETKFDDQGNLEGMVFEIFSNELELTQLKKWINATQRDFSIAKKNQLGDKKYFFNEIPVIPPKEMDGSYRMDQAPRNLSFKMTEFSTNKKLDTIFGEEIKPVKRMVDLFMNNKEWYVKRGIPHTLGMLLYGPPGTGKTSTIKAIAKDTGKHIVNISLRQTTTQTQMDNLFFDENIRVINSNGNLVTYCIPLNKRIYIIEDVDCLTDIVLSRKKEEEKEEKQVVKQPEQSEEEEKQPKQGTPIDLFFKSNDLPKKYDYDNVSPSGGFTSSYEDISKKKPTKKSKEEKEQNNSDLINLSYLLNLLDGVLETPERLLIMTSNHPEKLDAALIRPGRVDLVIKFGRCTSNTVGEMFNYFFDIENENKNQFEFDESFNKKLTPAEVTQVLGSNYTDINKAYEELKKKVNSNEEQKKEEKKQEEKEIEKLRKLAKEQEEKLKKQEEENETKIKENEEKLKKQEEEMEQKIKEILEKQEEENKRLRKEFEEEKDILRTSLNKTTIKVLPPKGKRQRKRV